MPEAGCVAGLQVLVNQRGDLRLGQSAHFGGDLLAVLEHHEGGDAANAKARRRGAVFVNVHLHDLQLAFVGGGQLVQCGRDGFAGVALFGPEIKQNGLVGLQDIGVKGSVAGVFDQGAGHGHIPSEIGFLIWPILAETLYFDSAARPWLTLLKTIYPPFGLN